MNKVLGAAAAAFVASGAVFAQPELERATTDAQIQLVEQINESRAADGRTAAGAIEPLRALARVYQEDGNHALASAALEEARYVTRVHQGLASADEALLLRQQIRSEQALGDHERVWSLEQDMVTIARQHHDDVRMLPVFRELADDRLSVSEQIRAGELPPMIFVGCYYGAPLPPYDDTRGQRRPPLRIGDAAGGPTCNSGGKWTVIGKLRAEILMYYADAIEIILKTGDYRSEELRQLEKAALRLRSNGPAAAVRYGESSGSFAFCFGGTLDHYLALEILGSCLAPVGRADNFVVANVGGPVSLIRLISYEIRSDAPAADRARAIAELADLHLLSTPVDRRHFEESTDRALALYERAYGELQQDDEARASIFSPEVPITFTRPRPGRAGMPFEYTHAPDTFASVATAKSSRYIDVSFEITKYGRGEKIEILDTSKGSTRAEERDLVRLIESSSFRPRVVNGELAASAPVVVRYRLGPG